MKISGFSFARNADKLGYPVVESIMSILPICDEFVIAVGLGDNDDRTRELIAGINDQRIKIIDTKWTDLEKLRSHIYSQQTNIALDQCSGDWCFYIQCDEVVHEKYLPHIKENCQKYLHTNKVEGFLFNYKHFWGDYDHYFINHKWYPREVRIVRNGIGVGSIGDAQSFNRGKKKLNVLQLNADMFHYGFVRHPKIMQARNLVAKTNYYGIKKAQEIIKPNDILFDYGSLENLQLYRDTYPATMAEKIHTMNWKNLLQYSGKSTVKFHHDKLKYKILTFIEQKIFAGTGKEPWGYKNYKLIKRVNLNDS